MTVSMAGLLFPGNRLCLSFAGTESIRRFCAIDVAPGLTAQSREGLRE